MNIFRKLSFFTLLLITFPIVVFAATDTARILQEFKEREKVMIFESNGIFLDEEDKNILSNYRRLSIFTNIEETIRGQRTYLEGQSEKISSRVSSLESSIKQLDEDISNLVTQVNEINTNIIETKRQIDTTTLRINVLQKNVEQSTEVLMEYLVYLYKKGEYVSSENDIDNLKSILLSGERIDELINDLYFKSLIQVTGQQLIDKHRGLISELYVKKLELSEAEKTMKMLRKNGIIEKNLLDEKRASRERLLEATKGQELLYQKYVQDALEKERGVKVRQLQERIAINNTKKKLLERYNCEFIDVALQSNLLSTLSEECIGINKIIYAESRLSGVSLTNNPLSWPIMPYAGISAYFRDAIYKQQFGEDHDAIDIIAPQGTEIKAPADGYVIFIEPPFSTGYSYFALKHSDELVTVYGHVSEIKVGLYDFVKEGDVIALSGGEFGTPGAGLMTTGPHLHFVVYENQEYRDPLDYLDVSYLQYASLSDRYRFKFRSDFKIRRGYEYTPSTEIAGENRFKIVGNTEVERQKYLLDTYAVGAFRDWNIWVEESLAGGIDPTFVMCVGLAETTLGKYMKTPYNIGNVGNTDSGATVTFPNARTGIHWMVKTFNNRFLSQYNEIQELSRYGNKDGSKPIYASSDFNWHNNIIKCMSHVKGEYVPDAYNFRIQ